LLENGSTCLVVVSPNWALLRATFQTGEHLMATVEGSTKTAFQNIHPKKNLYETDQNPQGFEHISIAYFGKLWRRSVDDNYLTLYGFQRYQTSHFLNLRFLEAEINIVDRAIYQAGLSLDYVPILDRLGLTTAQKDATPASKTVDRALVLHLRDLLKQYG
jgi:hypothetical protein